MTWYSPLMPLPPWMSRASRAMARALPQLLRFIRLMASGTQAPWSMSRPRARAPSNPRAISVCMSASFFWTSWRAARGLPNTLRLET